MGPGDPPVTLYHRTTSDKAANIIREGFNAELGPSGKFNFFSLADDGGSGAGTRAASANTVLEFKLDISSAKEISYNTYTTLFDEGLKQQGYTREAFNAIADPVKKSQIQGIADGIRNTKLWNLMKQMGGDIFKIDNGKNGFIAATNKATKNADFLGIRGAGRVNTAARLNTLGETDATVAAAKSHFGAKFQSAFKWGGRVVVLAAVTSDFIEIYNSDNKIRTITKKIGAWTTAGYGASRGSRWGTFAGPWGRLIGGLVGGAIGYFSGEKVTETVYDYFFTPASIKTNARGAVGATGQW